MMPTSLIRAVDARDPPRPETTIAAYAGPGTVVIDGRALVNMASNDYLGLAHDPHVKAAAAAALEEWGLGTAAGRILSGTTAIHVELEARLAAWAGCHGAALHNSCWTANAAVADLLAALAAKADATLEVFSDRLNHASIIDGLRGQRAAITALRLYDHQDLQPLHDALDSSSPGAMRAVITDGVFSMEGDCAPLAELADLCDIHEALLIVDDSHGTGVVGQTGRGTPEATGTLDRVDVITGTLGKALGGAIGGFVAGPARLIDTLRAMSRPYTFSNNPPTLVAAGVLAALDVLESDSAPLATLRARTTQLRDGVRGLGLDTPPADHPIVSVILDSDERAREASAALNRAGVHATALTFPVVPRDTARLRLQVSAAHSRQAIDQVLNALAAL